MISPDHALLAWIAISFLLTAMLPGYKAFTWAFLGAMFFMPSNLDESFQIAGLPVLAKDAAVVYGMVPATLIFHFRRLTVKPVRDWLLVGMALAGCVTSLVNGLPLYDGLSVSLGYFLQFTLIVFLVRVHVRTTDHAKYFLKSLYWLSVFYAVLCVWEWRMSPQLHTDVYGYFPHMFLQMARGSFYRPVVFFGHGLEVGYVYAIVVLVGWAFIRNREPGIPPYTIAAPIVALMCSMSMGPILFALFGVGLMTLFERRRLGPVLTLLPFAVLVLCLLSAGDQSHFGFIVDVVKDVNPERAESLSYRLHAFELYIQNIMKNPIFGHGTWGRGRIEGVATDSALLIFLLAYGACFAVLRYGWLWASLRFLRRRVNDSRSSRQPGQARIDHLAAALYWVLWLGVIYDFIVEGTTLILMVICIVVNGDLRPRGRAPVPEAPRGTARGTGTAEPQEALVESG